MREADGIVGLSIPFVAGTTAGWRLSLHVEQPYLPASLCLFTILILTLTLLHPSIRKTKGQVCALYFVLGAFCFLSEDCSSFFASGRSSLQEYAGSVATKTSKVIDSIPFSSEEYPALIKALLTGNRSSLTRETTAIFRSSGASHILALSGLHLGIIYMILIRLTAIIGRSPIARMIRSAFILTAVWFYATATGSGPSIVRASLFITIKEIAGILHRTSRSQDILCAAVTIQLAVSPSSIASVGFQLSYLAMAGITFIYPAMKAWYPQGSDNTWTARIDIPRRIWDSASLAISCQITTFPVVLGTFGTFPTYFLLTNMLAMPLVSIIMVVSIATAILTVTGTCPHILIAAQEKILSIFLWILRTISEM